MDVRRVGAVVAVSAALVVGCSGSEDEASGPKTSPAAAASPTLDEKQAHRSEIEEIVGRQVGDERWEDFFLKQGHELCAKDEGPLDFDIAVRLLTISEIDHE